MNSHSLFFRGFLVLFFALGFSSPSFAQIRDSQPAAFSVQQLTELFEINFTSFYQSGECGTNTRRLLDEANRVGINVEAARFVFIENQGFSATGLVNVERARGSARDRNWFHHVVIELDCKIIDFDFTNSPRVLSMKNYFEEMFFNENEPTQPGSFKVGRDRKSKEYSVKTYSFRNFAENQKDTPTDFDGILGDYVRICD